MTRIALDAAVLDDGIENVNFFNGRVLTAEDMRDEQEAGAEHRRRIGRAHGPGVCVGLEAARGADGRSVEVLPGLGVSWLGDVVELAEATTVALVVPSDVSANGAGSPFAPCTSQPSADVVSGDGFYALCIAQTAGVRGRAPAVGYETGVASSCGARYTVEGTVFRLVSIDVGGLAQRTALDDDALAALEALPGGPGRPRTRNVLAHLLLGTALDVDRSPLEISAPSALDLLREAGTLTGCDVPLALVSWADGGIEFVDTWAVRRRPVPSAAVRPVWRSFTGPLRPAVREAVLGQFQEQVATVVDEVALDLFRYLPAAGVLPAPLDSGFFSGLPVHAGEALYPERVEALVRASQAHPPIDLLSGDVIRVYDIVGGQDRVFASSYVPRAESAGVELVAITPARPLAAGETITLLGRGLMNAEVDVDGSEGAIVGDRSDTVLQYRLPGFEEQGAGVRRLTVRDGERSDWADVMVLTSGALSGKLVVSPSTLRPKIASGGLAVQFAVTSQLNRTADISLDASVEVRGGARVSIKPDVIEGLAANATEYVDVSVKFNRMLALQTRSDVSLSFTARSGAISDTYVLDPSRRDDRIQFIRTQRRDG